MRPSTGVLVLEIPLLEEEILVFFQMGPNVRGKFFDIGIFGRVL
jgi:hypothetical protein